ncbi:MAG: hypothetical protein ACREFM_02885 [Hypericibacter sp.]
MTEPHGLQPGSKIGETAPEAANDAKRKAVLEQKQFVTGRISETCRYIGFGVLAVFYAIQSSGTGFATKTAAKYPDLLYVMAVAAAAAILFDYLQYVSASWAVDKALNRKDKPNTYNKWWVSYQCRAAFFWLKQVAAFVSAICLCYIVLFPA